MASLQRTTLTIADGGTASEELVLRNVRSMSIQAPAALTGAVTLQSSSSAEASGTFTTVQSPPGTDISLAANKTTVLTAAPFVRVRLLSGALELGERVFTVWLVIGE